MLDPVPFADQPRANHGIARISDPIFQGLAISLLFGLLSSTALTVLVMLFYLAGADLVLTALMPRLMGGGGAG